MIRYFAMTCLIEHKRQQNVILLFSLAGLGAAFDTVKHSILAHGWENWLDLEV